MTSISHIGEPHSFVPPILIPIKKNDRNLFSLISIDKTTDEFFDNWCYALSLKRSFKTVRTYCIYNRVFLELLQYVTHIQGELTPRLLSQTIENYESYLVFGSSSEIPFIAQAAQALGDRQLSGSSVGVAIAALNHFIDASERFRIGLIELEAQGYISSRELSGFSLTQSVKIDAVPKLRNSIKKNSWLAGCLAGGARQIKRAGLSAISKPSLLVYADRYGGDEYAFPIDKCKELIESASNSRDRMLWSLLAASGARVSEVMTMLESDIQIKMDATIGRVRIVDPDTRRNVLLKFMSPREIDALPHKGRAHPETFLIEPFASMFWIYLEQYTSDLRKERLFFPERHRFLLRNLRTGQPMHSSYQTLYERFNKAALKITGRSYGFHSLRHMYGYYLVNHCPNPNPHNSRKHGLEISLVQKLMGHSQLKTTKRYARQDAHLLEATIASANLTRLSGGVKTILDSRIAYHEQEIKQLRQLTLEQA